MSDISERKENMCRLSALEQAMTKRLLLTLRTHQLLPRLRSACRSWVHRRPTWDLSSSVKWLVFAGLFMYSRNLESSGGIWEWRESFLGISVPTLTSSAIWEGSIAACLLASFIFFIEPLLPIRWSRQTIAARKHACLIVVDGILSWFALVLGVLPIFSASRDWWGGGLIFLLGVLLLLAMPVKTAIDACRAYKGVLTGPTRC